MKEKRRKSEIWRRKIKARVIYIQIRSQPESVEREREKNKELMFKSYQHLLYKDCPHDLSIAAMINKSHPNQVIHNANNKRQIQNKTLVHTHHGGRVCFTFKHKTFLPLRKKKVRHTDHCRHCWCTEHKAAAPLVHYSAS